MAKKPVETNNSDAAPGQSGPSLVVVLAVSLLLGTLGGGTFGYAMLPSEQQTVAAIPAEKSGEDKSVKALEPPQGRFPVDAVEIALAPIITTLGEAKKTNIRMDISLVTVKGVNAETTLKDEIREDVIAYLWGLELSQIEGGRGFQNLREELDERAVSRGGGAVLGLLIGGLVVQ